MNTPAGKKVLVALPTGLLDKVDGLAGREFRTRSDLVREALRDYVDKKERMHGPIETSSTLSVKPGAPGTAVLINDPRQSAGANHHEGGLVATAPGEWSYTKPKTPTILD